MIKTCPHTITAALLVIFLLLTGCSTYHPVTPHVRPAYNEPSKNASQIHADPHSPAQKQQAQVDTTIPANRYIGPVLLIIDPGHGGKDPGTWSTNGQSEKKVNFSIALILADILKKRGVHVIMTRTNDRFVSLDQRAAIAQAHEIDLFVSIHADHFKDPAISGATVLVGRTASRQSRNAAVTIKNAMENAGIKCRSIRAQQLRVLENHPHPAVLVECGFLSNHQEARNLTSNWYQNKVALAIADGITDYFQK